MSKSIEVMRFNLRIEILLIESLTGGVGVGGITDVSISELRFF